MVSGPCALSLHFSVVHWGNLGTALHLRQKSIISSGPARAVGAPHTDIQCLLVSELLIISTLATAKPRAEPEADSKHFDTDGAFHLGGIGLAFVAELYLD